jgi:uncharacterized repeat protein (TIGR03943 family)
LVWLEILAVLTWGILLVKYWVTDQIHILLHPDYTWLALSTGLLLIGLALLRTGQRLRIRRYGLNSPAGQHLALLPRKWSSGLLLAVALLGLGFTPQPFASQVAINRGVTDTLTLTRSQPQAFRTKSRPDQRSLIDWIRTLNVYPEPDAYSGQPVNVEGFVILSPHLSQGYFTLARFVITCCAADAYPVGLPVKLPAGQVVPKADIWLQVKGEMITETLNGQRQLVIQATNIGEISAPANPYSY